MLARWLRVDPWRMCREWTALQLYAGFVALERYAEQMGSAQSGNGRDEDAPAPLPADRVVMGGAYPSLASRNKGD